MYFALTGTIWLGGAGSIIVGGRSVGYGSITGRGQPDWAGPNDCADNDLFLSLANDLKRLDVGVHVREGRNPVQIVVTVDVNIGGKAQVSPPTLDEPAPEKVAYGHLVGLLVAQRLAEPVNLRLAFGGL